MTSPLLRVRNLRVEFPTRRATLRAIDDISFDIMPGEVLGVVGESGAGKSVTGAAIIGLIDAPGRIAIDLGNDDLQHDLVHAGYAQQVDNVWIAAGDVVDGAGGRAGFCIGVFGPRQVGARVHWTSNIGSRRIVVYDQAQDRSRILNIMGLAGNHDFVTHNFEAHDAVGEILVDFIFEGLVRPLSLSLISGSGSTWTT